MPLSRVGRHTLRLTCALIALTVSVVGVPRSWATPEMDVSPAADAAAAPTPAASTPTINWSPTDIVRHMDQLESITDPQAKTNEFLRVLIATMSVPDPGTRMTLLNRLRTHFAPLDPPPAPAATDAPPTTPAH